MRRLLLCLSLALSQLPSAAGAADGPDARLRDALRSATSQVRALEDEKARWLQREAELQKELAEARGQLAAARKERGGDRDAARKVAAAAEAQARLAEQLGACQAAGRQAEGAARGAEAERARASAGAAELAQRLAASEARNRRLYQVGREILDWLQAVGMADALAAREPFLGFRRVALENEAQAFDDRLREQRSTP